MSRAKKPKGKHTPEKVVANCLKQEQILPSFKNAEPPFVNVDAMTSLDFELDPHALIDTAAAKLKDHNSIRWFKDAILYNRHLFRGRTVLNIGCGIGLLSLFSAQAGAKRVFAVDSSNVLDYTQQIVRDNGYANVIHVIKGHIEEIELPVRKVDIIICNWVGFSLLYQSSCDAVIYARDKWLVKDGLIFPDVGTLFVCAMDDTKYRNDRSEWWNDVYGFNMQCIRESAIREPFYEVVEPEQIMCKGVRIKTLNLNKAKKEDLQFRSKFTFKMLRNGRVDGMCTYFHIHFTKTHTPTAFGTGPHWPQTQWMQSIFYFDSPHHVKKDALYHGDFEMVYINEISGLKDMQVAFKMMAGNSSQITFKLETSWQLNRQVLKLIEKDKKETATAANDGTSSKLVKGNNLAKGSPAKELNVKNKKPPVMHAKPCAIYKEANGPNIQRNCNGDH